MRQQNSDDISSEMIRIMDSDEHKKLFSGSIKLSKIAQDSKDPKKDPEKELDKNSESSKKDKEDLEKQKDATPPVTARSAIVDLVKIAEFFASKGMIQEENITSKLLESIALENRKNLRKQAEEMLSTVSEDVKFEDKGSPADNEDEDEDEDEDENEDEKTGTTDDVKKFEKAMLEDDNESLGESSVVPY